MRNLIKKSLAFLLVAALALTCFVGTLTVSAENPTATIVVTADAVEVGATEIPVTLTVTSETGINEALIKVSSDLGDIIAQPTVEANTPADADNTEGAANYNAFYLSARNVDDGTGNTTLGAITTATIKVVFTRTEAIVAGTYNVDVEIPEGKVIAASKDEVAIDIVCDGLEIVVEEVASCDHANATKEVTTQPTKDAEGVMTYTCECGETWTEAIAKPTQDDSIALRDGLMNISNALNLKFRARKSASVNVYPNYTFKLVLETKKYDISTYNIIPEPVVNTYDMVTEGNHIVAMQPCGMYELDLPATAYMAAYDENGVFVKYSASLDIVPLEALKSLFKTEAEMSSYTEAQKNVQKATNRLVTDIVNMGTAAQNYFPTLINSTTCDLYKATKMNANWDANQSWATTSLEGIMDVENADWNPASTINSSTNNFYCSVNLAGAPALVFNIRRASTTGGNPLDYSKLNLKVSYTTLFNGERIIEDEIEGDEWNEYVLGKNLGYVFSKAAMYDSNKTITAVLTYDGVEVINYTYSLDSFVSQNANNAKVGDIVTKIGYFNASARNYFVVQSGTTV